MEFKEMIIGGKYTIKYCFTEEAIHLKNTSDLRDYMYSIDGSAYKVADALKEKYEEEMGEEFDVSTTSLGIEIAGHVDVGSLTDVVQNIVDKIPLVGDKIVDFLEDKAGTPTDVIDMGTSDKDGNRWVWDTLESVARLLGGGMSPLII